MPTLSNEGGISHKSESLMFMAVSNGVQMKDRLLHLLFGAMPENEFRWGEAVALKKEKKGHTTFLMSPCSPFHYMVLLHAWLEAVHTTCEITLVYSVTHMLYFCGGRLFSLICSTISNVVHLMHSLYKSTKVEVCFNSVLFNQLFLFCLSLHMESLLDICS